MSSLTAPKASRRVDRGEHDAGWKGTVEPARDLNRARINSPRVLARKGLERVSMRLRGAKYAFCAASPKLRVELEAELARALSDMAAACRAAMVAKRNDGECDACEAKLRETSPECPIAKAALSLQARHPITQGSQWRKR
jgi:hypothetical protein